MMSIVCETDCGWYIDHETAVTTVYKRCHIDNSIKSYGLKSVMFDIQCPFMMDTHFNNWKLQQQTSGESKTRKRKRKNKSKEEDCEAEAVKLGETLISSHQSVLATARKHGRLQERLELPDNNNKAARLAANIAGPGDRFAELAEMWSKGDNPWQPPVDISGTEDLEIINIFHRRVSYKGDNPYVIHLEDGRYLIPPRSSFVMSDFNQLLSNIHSIQVPGGYHLIVVDPPWMNKSVKRKKSYSSLDEESLLSIPVPDLASPDCLIVVWVTNKPCLLEFVQEHLLPFWGVDDVQQWHWVKVTVYGDLVCDINSPTKKPYETLLLGRIKTGHQTMLRTKDSGHHQENTGSNCTGADNFHPTVAFTATGKDNVVLNKASLSDGSFSHFRGDNFMVSVPGGDNSGRKVCPTDRGNCSSVTKTGEMGSYCDLPDNQVLLSVPCSLHSKKPPLQDVLHQYLPPEPRCLELFARNLWPGWVSWGHEALKHQHLDYYEEKT